MTPIRATTSPGGARRAHALAAARSCGAGAGDQQQKQRDRQAMIGAVPDRSWLGSRR